MKSSSVTLLAALNKILHLTQRHSSVTIKQIVDSLERKAPFVLLILFSFPFCIPIQIPGFSTPFGIAIACLGIQLMLNKSFWLPQWVLKKQFSSKHLKPVIKKTIKGVTWAQKFIRPRWQELFQSPFTQRLTGVLVFILALLLSLPLPIPATNLLSATPIFCIAISFLKDDGFLLMLGYTLSLLCFAAFGVLFWVGWVSLQAFF